MAQMPTVRLVHKRDRNNVRVLDQFYYATHLDDYRDFVRVGESGGDATDRQVEAAIAEHDANEARRIERDAERDFHRDDITPASAEMKAALTGDEAPGGEAAVGEPETEPAAADAPEAEEATEDEAPVRRRGRRPRAE